MSSTGITLIYQSESNDTIVTWAVYNGNGTKTVIISETVTSIAANAFINLGTNLTEITIPNSVTSVGSNALTGCRNLTSVTIQNNEISDLMFNNCNSLENITVPSSVTSVGTFAFNDCTSLTNITIKNNLINETMFQGCNSLKNILELPV